MRFLKKQFHAFFCVRSKSKILRVKNVKKTNLTHPKAAKLTTLDLLINQDASELLNSDTDYVHLSKWLQPDYQCLYCHYR